MEKIKMHLVLEHLEMLVTKQRIEGKVAAAMLPMDPTKKYAITVSEVTGDDDELEVNEHGEGIQSVQN